MNNPTELKPELNPISCPCCHGQGLVFDRDIPTILRCLSHWNDPPDRWIPVGERLPAEGFHVLLFRQVIQIAYQLDGIWFNCATEEDTNGTHWRELPKPPVEKDSK